MVGRKTISARAFGVAEGAGNPPAVCLTHQQYPRTLALDGPCAFLRKLIKHIMRVLNAQLHPDSRPLRVRAGREGSGSVADGGPRCEAALSRIRAAQA